MRVGFTVLAHERLDRVAALAGHLAGQGAPVVVHVDRRVRDLGPLNRLAGVGVLRTRRADWGRFGLVEAALDCAKVLLSGPPVDHVCLLSGACLPVRRVDDLAAMLAADPGRDFIESVPLAKADWVQGGLSIERLTMFHPFCWRRRRWLFDASVAAQRALGVQRRLPAGLAPHLGLQWWCLSTVTLRALLSDPRLPAWRRFFRSTWIPDEAFFQTLVRALRPDRWPAPPLHLARFDPRGRPYAFHDDHADLLARSGAWFARKIDVDAGGLYHRFLGDIPAVAPAPRLSTEAPFLAARRRERQEGRGRLSAARYPRQTGPVSVETAVPYLVVMAEDPAAACAGLVQDPRLAVHDRLLSEAPCFAGGEQQHWGNLCSAGTIRDHRPAQFLALTVRADRAMGRRSVFGFPSAGAAADPLGAQIAGDPNARLAIFGDPQSMLARLGLPTAAQSSLRAWWTRVGPALAGSNRLAALALSDWTKPDSWTIPRPSGGCPI